jgi:hypothetical protein
VNIELIDEVQLLEVNVKGKITSVFELPGGLGLNPQLFASPPNKMPWDTLGSVSTPAVVNDAESPVCNDNE